jgi:KUP system potassium uptake protein
MSHSAAALSGGSAAATNGGDASVKVGFWSLALGSIGVVYGDIGTSPLYALREAVLAATGSGNPASEAVVLGILSLIIWALLLVVTAKYVLILLRADNNGEGGTLALMALASRVLMRRGGLVIFSASSRCAFLWRCHHYTPALSVLGDRRLKIVSPRVRCPRRALTVLVLVSLFAVQSRGRCVAASSGYHAVVVRGYWAGRDLARRTESEVFWHSIPGTA